MNFIAVNGFELPNDNKIKTTQFAGYITRDSDVCVKFIDNYNLYSDMIPNLKVNRVLISRFKSFNKFDEESQLLDYYRSKIENPNSYIKQLGRELIEDYNYEYVTFRRGCEKKMLKINNDDYINDYSIYFNTPKMCLIRLEQLFILNDLPTWYIFEFIKPNKNNFGKHIFGWIKTITKFDINKIKRLRVYLDEYLQYLFDRPQNIYKINKLALPIDFPKEIKLDEFAGYLTRTSIVVLEFIDNNLRLVTSDEANNSFMSWFRAIYGENSNETKIITEYRSNIEKLMKKINNYKLNNEKLSSKKIKIGTEGIIAKLGMELIPDYCDNNVHSEHKQCLIDLEQLIIRHGMPTGIIFEYTKKDGNPINYDLLDWIKRITKLEKKKIVLLKEYLDLYLDYVIYRKKDDRNINEVWYKKSFSKSTKVKQIVI
jgi:hypothetical protein